MIKSVTCGRWEANGAFKNVVRGWTYPVVVIGLDVNGSVGTGFVEGPQSLKKKDVLESVTKENWAVDIDPWIKNPLNE